LLANLNKIVALKKLSVHLTLNQCMSVIGIVFVDLAFVSNFK